MRIPYTRLHTHKIFRPRVDPSPPHKIFSRGGDGIRGKGLWQGHPISLPHAPTVDINVGDGGKAYLPLPLLYTSRGKGQGGGMSFLMPPYPFPLCRVSLPHPYTLLGTILAAGACKGPPSKMTRDLKNGGRVGGQSLMPTYPLPLPPVTKNQSLGIFGMGKGKVGIRDSFPTFPFPPSPRIISVRKGKLR